MEINQIKNQLDIYHDQLNANREKFEKVYEESNLKFVNYRNIILTIVPTIIALLFTFQSSNIAKEFTIFHLTTEIAIVVAISFGIYPFFTIQKQKKSSEYLRIQKVFHDGYTTINFMKGLMHNLRYTDQLNENGLASLDTYFFIIRGGIVKRIRKKIHENTDRFLSEKQIYGDSEGELYTSLIKSASKLYKNNKDIEEDLLKLFKNYTPYDLFSIFNKYYISELECSGKEELDT